ncbi:membrane protein [Collibacillus ludicampi]|uniref:Membrane protein n=1 Tax=Collibacillus ludicampi TaxID=2771369 RepID=A0AAV4LG91_9BACL|nr:AEC family transporter [Collibacillus ludicampi]GIM46654.1 membrane protein [Collibacillus ludicampi]
MGHAFLSTIYHVFLPILFPVIGGALLYRFRGIDTKPISTLALYVLSPALIFESIFKAKISFHDISEIMIFSFVNLLSLWLISTILCKLYSLSMEERAGLTMVSTFTNCVNYGLPLVMLAFGKSGLDIAAVYVIIQMILVNTLGVYFAARSHFTVKKAVKSVFAMPSVYATLLAVLLRLLHVHLPDTVDKGFTMLSDSYSPVVLSVLGVQMMSVKRVKLPQTYQRAFWAGLFVRLLAAPLLAYVILNVIAVKGLLFSVLLILASMPAAVNAIILAEQFNAAPQCVSKCILWTTLSSFLVLPVILKMLT